MFRLWRAPPQYNKFYLGKYINQVGGRGLKLNFKFNIHPWLKVDRIRNYACDDKSLILVMHCNMKLQNKSMQVSILKLKALMTYCKSKRVHLL